MPVHPEIKSEVVEQLGVVPKWLEQMPQSAQVGYWNMARDFWLGETKLDGKTKELIGLAVSAVTRCRYCTLFHTEAAKLHGASPEEIAEANAMASVTMLGSTFINGQQIDYDQFRKETEQIVSHVRKNMR